MKSNSLAGRKVTLTIVSLLGLALWLTGDQLLADTNVPVLDHTEPVDAWLGSGLLVVALIALAAGVVHSGIGFGFGIVAIALMPLVIDARQTHLLVSLVAVPVQLGTVWAYRKGVVWKPLLFALVGATIGLPAGLWLFKVINLDWLTRGTGIAILFMIGYTFVVRNLASRRSSAQSVPPGDQAADGDTQDLSSSKTNSGEAAGASAIGVASGFLMGAVTMPGPPVVAYALQRDWSQDEFKSFVNQFLLALSLFKVAGLFVTADVSQQSLSESLFVFPAALIGIAIGKRFSQHLSTGGFRTIVAVVLSLVAILLIVKGAG